MQYIGFDPSFKGFGIAVIDTETKVIKLFKESVVIKKGEFLSINRAAQEQIEKVCHYLPEFDCVVGMETPPPNSFYSAGLWCLDSLLFDRLKRYSVNCYYPTYIGHLHNKRKWLKSESVELAKKFQSEFKKLGYSVEGRLSADACEAFIFATNLFVLCNESISSGLIEVCPRIIENKIIGGEFNA